VPCNRSAAISAIGRRPLGNGCGVMGSDPAGTVVVNPLPLHHVQCLLPLLRKPASGVPLRLLAPA